jgi:hypothetical protein
MMTLAVTCRRRGSSSVVPSPAISTLEEGDSKGPCREAHESNSSVHHRACTIPTSTYFALNVLPGSD